MMTFQRVIPTAILLTAVALGCSDAGGGKKPRHDAGQDGGDPEATAVAGYWTGDWGDLVMHVVGDEMWGAYTHDEGTVRGRFANGVFTGWWAEVPSRLPTSDAGEVEFTFIVNPDAGGMGIDGRWRYGDATNEPAWRENWDLAIHSADAEPAALVARFADTAAFVAHP
jgi:hypothetical protein